MWPFYPACPVNMRFYVLNRRYDIPSHRPSHFEVIVIESGDVVYEAQGISSVVRRGDLVVVGNKLHHRCRATGQFCPEVRGKVLYLKPTLLETWSAPKEEFQYLVPFLFQDLETPHIIPAKTGVPAKVSELIDMLRTELSGASRQSDLAARTYVKMIAILLASHYAEFAHTRREFARASLEVGYLRPLSEFLESNCAKQITAADGARALDMSGWQFPRFLKRVAGCSFVPYLTRFRISKAKQLLACTGKPIADICQEVGFCDQSYFGHIFHKLVLMTPLQYRNRYRYQTGQ